MNEFTNLINQTKEDLIDCNNWIKNVSWHDKIPRNIEVKQKVLQERLSTLQTARDIFIKMLDEAPTFNPKINMEQEEKDPTDAYMDEDWEGVWINKEEIKSKLLGDKTE